MVRGRTHERRAAVVLSAVLAAALSGCLDGLGPRPRAMTDASDSPAITMSACRQFHTFFQSPAPPFEPLVPEGFAMQRDATGAFAQVVVFASVCLETAQLWAGLAVAPPDRLRNDSVDVDLVVLQGFTTNTTHAALYADWGLADRVLAATLRASDGVTSVYVRHDVVELGDANVRYRLETTYRSQPDGFPPAAYRYWVPDGQRATGFILAQNLEGVSVGLGTAVFSQSGDAAAPPLTAGVGHRVDDGAATERFVAV